MKDLREVQLEDFKEKAVLRELTLQESEEIKLHIKWLNNENEGKQLNWSNKNMSYINFYGIDFSKAILHNTNFSGCVFFNVNFSFAICTKSNMAYVEFYKSNLSNANFDQANLFQYKAYNTKIEARIIRSAAKL